MAALARRLGVPFRSGGNLCASKVADAQAAYESAATFGPTILGGVNFVLHAAGWLEGGLTVGYEKFILDTDQCGMAAVFVKGVDMTENGQALDAMLQNPPGQHHLGIGPHAGQLRDRVLPVRDRRQQLLRAVGGGRRARRGAAGERDLEADARRVRGAADRSGRRRGAAGVHRPAQGVDAGLRGLGSVLFRRRQTLAPPAREALARILADPTFELVPLKNALDQADVPAARATGLGHRVAGQGARGDRRAVRAAPGARLPGGAAPVGSDGPRPGPPRRPDRLARGRRRRSGVRRRRRREGAGRLSRRPVAAAGDAEIGHPLSRDRDPVLSAGPRVHRRPARCSTRSATRPRTRPT